MWEQSQAEVNHLLGRIERGFATVDLSAILSNMESMHKALQPGTRMMGVIKTNGYGHGAIPIARELEELPYVFGYAAATVEEALSLRVAGIQKPILILGHSFPYSFKDLAKQEIRTAVFQEDALLQMSEVACRVGKPIKVHIKVDTGMGRIGITPDDRGLAFVKKVSETKGIELEGIFTHFARADEVDKESAIKQYQIFKGFVERIKEELGIAIPLCHCSNSAGILELPMANMDMVRAGITLYGLMPSEEVCTDRAPIRPALSLYSHISFVKTLEKGQSVSYGGIYTATGTTRVATVPLGYGDGYPRMLTGKGEVLIKGKRFPIIGRICMDQFMVDITEDPSIEEGELVTLLGKDGEERITAEEIGARSGRFNYEFVCLLGDRIPRVFLKDGKAVYVSHFDS